MGEKRINFRKIIKGIKRQGIRMQQRLIVYWCVVILTLFLATVLLLSIIGVLPGMDFKVREMLSAQQKNTLSAMTEQTDIMMARSISLSEDITKELNQCLTANGKTFSDLNDNPQLIMDLESALYPSLKSALDVKYCSGVFVVLDATVNTKTEWLLWEDVFKEVSKLMEQERGMESLKLLFRKFEEDKTYYEKVFEVTGQNSFEEMLYGRIFNMEEILVKHHPLKHL